MAREVSKQASMLTITRRASRVARERRGSLPLGYPLAVLTVRIGWATFEKPRISALFLERVKGIEPSS
jgi:hypothetical protein